VDRSGGAVPSCRILVFVTCPITRQQRGLLV
jgi:hypothetical protein